MSRKDSGMSMTDTTSLGSSSAASGKGSRKKTDGEQVERKKSVTGLHLRGRLKSVLRTLTRVSEEKSIDSLWAHDLPLSSESCDFASITELKVVVSALDGLKSGFVDYTLLVAIFLEPDVYSDDLRASEIFDQFDLRKVGLISGEDLFSKLRQQIQPSAKSSFKSIRPFADMISEFDRDKDGCLNLKEFSAMLEGGRDAEEVCSDLKPDRQDVCL